MSAMDKGNAPSRGTGGAQEDRTLEQNRHHQPCAPSIAGGGGRGEAGDLLPNPEEAVAFLEGWRPGGPWVLTAISVKGGGTQTVTLTDPGEVRQWVQDHSGGRWNLYFTVNETFGPVTSKPKKTGLAAATGLHVDVDPRPGEELEAERERALRLLRAYDPAPTAIVDSGGGYQAFWKAEEPVTLDGDPAPIENRNLRIEADLQADACHNIDRLMRLPGTVNWPNEKKRMKGRVARLASVVDAEWSRTYRLADFPEAELAKAAPASRGRSRKAGEAPAQGVMLEDLPEGVDDLTKAVVVNGHDPDNPDRWDGSIAPDGSWQGDRSKAVWWVACQLARARVDEATIAGILLDPDYGISAHVRDQKGAERYAQKQARDAWEEVESDFVCDKDGRPLPNNQHNIRVALRRLGVSLWHDEFAGRELVEGLGGYGPALDDPAAIRLRLEIDERFGFRPTKDFFLDVLSDQARRNARHPVLEHLAALHWDGVPRIDGWLAEYGGAVDTPYTRAVGALLLVAAVRRVRRPGVKFDEMLVLESAQGTNKSTALKVLAGRDEWFTDDMPLNAESKRVIEALSGKWIVEAGELKGNRKAGTDHLKGFLSRTHDKARMAYDRREREVPRQCVIVGTTNDSRYLRDTTGNRRFWPVAVQGFDLDALRRDRDQLWAEAAAREAEGVPIRLDPELWADAEAEQDARRVEDPFYERLYGALGDALKGKLKAEDAWRIVGRPSGQRTQDDNARLSDAMRRLDFARTKRRFGLPNPEWCYVRGEGNVPQLVPRFDPEGELDGVVEAPGHAF